MAAVRLRACCGARRPHWLPSLNSALTPAQTGLASFLITTEERAYSRTHEAEADELGLSICTRACYDKAGAMSSMHKLQQVFGTEGKQHASWLDTHPAEVRASNSRRVARPNPSVCPRSTTLRLSALAAAMPLTQLCPNRSSAVTDVAGRPDSGAQGAGGAHSWAFGWRRRPLRGEEEQLLGGVQTCVMIRGGLWNINSAREAVAPCAVTLVEGNEDAHTVSD